MGIGDNNAEVKLTIQNKKINLNHLIWNHFQSLKIIDFKRKIKTISDNHISETSFNQKKNAKVKIN